MNLKKTLVVRYGQLFLCTVILATVAGCTGQQEKQPVTRQFGPDIASGTTLVATIPDEVKPPPPIPGHEAAPANQSTAPAFQIIFSESGKGVAYVAGKGEEFYVVHNNNRGKLYPAVATVVLSPDGRHAAYGAVPDSKEGKWCMVVDGKEEGRYDTVLTPLFSPDGQHRVYQAKIGAKWYMVVDGKLNGGTVASYTTPEFSADSTSIVYVEAAASNSQMKLIVSNMAFGRESVKMSIGDLLFVTNRWRSRIAAAQVVDGKFRIILFNFTAPDVVHEGPLYNVIERLTLSSDGLSVCYCALQGRKRLMVLDDKEEVLPEGHLPELPVIRPDHKGVGAILLAKNRYFLHQAFLGTQQEKKDYDEAANLSYGAEGNYAYAARNGKDWFVVVNGSQGPTFDRVVDPLFSPDGKHVAYRARKDGKRFVVVADLSGKTVRVHPPYEQVLETRFTADGKHVAYGVKDGQKLIWKVEPL